MARKTGKTERFFPDHVNDDDHVAVRRLRRQALLGTIPVDVDSIDPPYSEEVQTYTVDALEGGKVKLDDDGRPVVVDGRAVLEEPPEVVERVVRADQVEEYEAVLADRQENEDRDELLAAVNEEKD